MDYSFLTDHIDDHIEGHLIPSQVSIDAFAEIYSIVQPKRILEIGFNAGHSAFMTLEMLPDVIYRSVDICRHSYTLPNGTMLNKKYGNRFVLLKANSSKIIPSTVSNFDLMFIDGDHSVKGLSADLLVACKAKIPYILIDDYNDDWFPELVGLMNHLSKNPEFPYKNVKTFDYESRDGISTCLLMRYTNENT